MANAHALAQLPQPSMVWRNAEAPIHRFNGFLPLLCQEIKPREAQINLGVSALLREGPKTDLNALAGLPAIPYGKGIVREHSRGDFFFLFHLTIAVLGEKVIRLTVELRFKRLSSTASQLLISKALDVDHRSR